MNETAQAKAALWCMAYETCIPDGYEVSGFNRITETDELVLCTDGEAVRKTISNCHYTGPILKRKAPEIEWVEPTDEDGTHRVDAEFSNIPGLVEIGDGVDGTLIGVILAHSGEYEYITSEGAHFGHCRMDAASKRPLPICIHFSRTNLYGLTRMTCNTGMNGPCVNLPCYSLAWQRKTHDT